jgi:predicted nucleotidyltransferase
MTLLDVIRAVREVAANDQETLATVVHLIRSGQVRLSEDTIKAMLDLLATADAAA